MLSVVALGIPNYVVWIIIALLFLVVEGLTTALVSIWFIPGALAAAFVSVITDSVGIQVAVFLIISAICFPISKNIYEKKLRNKNLKSCLSMVGKQGLVLEQVTNFSGRVVINDVNYEARISGSEFPIPSDSIAEVVSVDGLILYVKPVMINNVD